MIQTGKTVLTQSSALRLLLANRFMLLSYINSISGNSLLSEKIFQQVGVAVIEKYATVSFLDDFRPWLRGLARKQLLKSMSQAKERAKPALKRRVTCIRMDNSRPNQPISCLY